jgi:hypothetical protein
MFAKMTYPHYGPTDAKDALVGATLMKPLPRERVPAILDGLLSNCIDCNACNDFAIPRFPCLGLRPLRAGRRHGERHRCRGRLRTDVVAVCQGRRFIEMAERLGGTSACRTTTGLRRQAASTSGTRRYSVAEVFGPPEPTDDQRRAGWPGEGPAIAEAIPISLHRGLLELWRPSYLPEPEQVGRTI